MLFEIYNVVLIVISITMATLKELAASHEFAEEGLSQIDFIASACGSLPDPISKPEGKAMHHLCACKVL